MELCDSQKKREIVESLLDNGMVMVVLDSRRLGVIVPEHLRDDPQLRLNISYRFGLPMRIDQVGVHATLTFNSSPFTCKIPWSAIYVVISHVSGQPHFFPTEVPGELLASFVNALDSHAPDDTLDGEPTQPAVLTPQLTVIPNDKLDNATPPPHEPPPKSPPRRGHLRLVK